jgi:hypothetical protein
VEWSESLREIWLVLRSVSELAILLEKLSAGQQVSALELPWEIALVMSSAPLLESVLVTVTERWLDPQPVTLWELQWVTGRVTKWEHRWVPDLVTRLVGMLGSSQERWMVHPLGMLPGKWWEPRSVHEPEIQWAAMSGRGSVTALEAMLGILQERVWEQK